MYSVYRMWKKYLCRQTGDKFYQRMLLNFSKIRTQKVEDPVAKHFCQKNHCVKNFSHRNWENRKRWQISRETKESLWIKKLKTFEPLGLNTKLDRHWLFINKIPRNQRHKLFYLHCNVMLFVFHICVVGFRWGRPQGRNVRKLI